MTNVKKSIKDGWYLQANKIKRLYDDESFLLPKDKDKVKSIKLGKIKKILRQMPLDLKLKIPLLEVAVKRDKGDISTYAMLLEVIGQLDENNNLLNLNEAGAEHIKSGQFVYFHGTGTFEEHETNPKMVTIRGIVNERKFFCNCSKKWLKRLSSSLFQTLLDAGKLIHDQNLNLFFLGKIIDKDYGPKGILLLDALYIGGSTEDVHKLWMRAQNL